MNFLRAASTAPEESVGEAALKLALVGGANGGGFSLPYAGEAPELAPLRAFGLAAIAHALDDRAAEALSRGGVPEFSAVTGAGADVLASAAHAALASHFAAVAVTASAAACRAGVGALADTGVREIEWREAARAARALSDAGLPVPGWFGLAATAGAVALTIEPPCGGGGGDGGGGGGGGGGRNDYVGDICARAEAGAAALRRALTAQLLVGGIGEGAGRPAPLAAAAAAAPGTGPGSWAWRQPRRQPWLLELATRAGLGAQLLVGLERSAAAEGAGLRAAANTAADAAGSGAGAVVCEAAVAALALVSAAAASCPPGAPLLSSGPNPCTSTPHVSLTPLEMAVPESPLPAAVAAPSREFAALIRPAAFPYDDSGDTGFSRLSMAGGSESGVFGVGAGTGACEESGTGLDEPGGAHACCSLAGAALRGWRDAGPIDFSATLFEAKDEALALLRAECADRAFERAFFGDGHDGTDGASPQLRFPRAPSQQPSSLPLLHPAAAAGAPGLVAPSAHSALGAAAAAASSASAGLVSMTVAVASGVSSRAVIAAGAAGALATSAVTRMRGVAQPQSPPQMSLEAPQLAAQLPPLLAPQTTPGPGGGGVPVLSLDDDLGQGLSTGICASIYVGAQADDTAGGEPGAGIDALPMAREREWRAFVRSFAQPLMLGLRGDSGDSINRGSGRRDSSARPLLARPLAGAGVAEDARPSPLFTALVEAPNSSRASLASFGAATAAASVPAGGARPFRLVRPSLLEVVLAWSRDPAHFRPREQAAAVAALDALLVRARRAAAESDESGVSDTAAASAEAAGAIARSWLLSCLYEVSDLRARAGTDPAAGISAESAGAAPTAPPEAQPRTLLPLPPRLLSPALRVSVAREFARWLPREAEAAGTGAGVDAGGDTVSPPARAASGGAAAPRPIFALAASRAQSAAAAHGALPPLCSELLSPAPAGRASPAIALHAAKALAFLTSGLASSSAGADAGGAPDTAPPSGAVAAALAAQGVGTPLAALLEASARGMRARAAALPIVRGEGVVSGGARDEKCEGGSSTGGIGGGGGLATPLSITAERDPCFRAHAALARQCLRLAANLACLPARAATPEAGAGVGSGAGASTGLDARQLLELRAHLAGAGAIGAQRTTSAATLGSFLCCHDIKLQGQAWRAAANLGLLFPGAAAGQAVDEASQAHHWRYGDLLVPIYATPDSGLDASGHAGAGVDIVLVHGLQGSALKAWRTGFGDARLTKVQLESLPGDGRGERPLFAPSRRAVHVLAYSDDSPPMPPPPLPLPSTLPMPPPPPQQQQQQQASSQAPPAPQRERSRLAVWPALWLAGDLESSGDGAAARRDVRLLALSYDAEVWGQGGVRPQRAVAETAAEAARQLTAAGVGARGRHLVLLCHSMGGLLAKQMLLGPGSWARASEPIVDAGAGYRGGVGTSSGDEVGQEGTGVGAGFGAPTHQSDDAATLARATCAVIFFSTPHRGAPIAEWAVRKLSGLHQWVPASRALAFPSQATLLLTESAALARLDDAFAALVAARQEAGAGQAGSGGGGGGGGGGSGGRPPPLRVLSLAETEPVRLAAAASGVLGRLPGGLVVVPAENARCGAGTFAVVAGADHVSVCKPPSRDCELYRRVLATVREGLAAADAAGRQG